MPSLRASATTTLSGEDYFWYAIFPELVFCFMLGCMFFLWKYYVGREDTRIIILTPHLQHIKPDSIRVHIEYTPVGTSVVRKDATADRESSPIPALSLGSPALTAVDEVAIADASAIADVAPEVKKNL